MDHYNRTESHELGSHIHGTLIYDKVYMIVDKKGKRIIAGNHIGKGIKLESYISSYTYTHAKK